MSMFLKVGNTILNSNKRNKSNIRTISLIHNKSEISPKTNSNFFKSTSKLMNYKNLNYKNNSTMNIQNPKHAINNELKDNNFLKDNKNFTTNTRYYKKEMNNYNKFKDLRNNVEFFSFNRNDYIKEANKIMSQRLIDKNADLIGKRSQDKINIISNTREIGRNNFVIDAIKKNINNIKLIEKNYKNSLVKSEKELKTDFTDFHKFLDSKYDKIKEENATLLNLRDKHEQALEKYDRELQRYKKLSEDLEKKVKIICLLKTYGAFIYKILGIKFWLNGIPEINQKTKNFEEISDLVIAKYKLLNEKEQANKEEDYFDDKFLIIKFKELEQRVIQSINSTGFQIRDLKEKQYKEETLKRMNSTITKLNIKKKDVTQRKNRLTKNIDKAESIKFDEESTNKYLEYIIELGKETEKFDLNISNFFPDIINNDYQKKMKEYDFQYYTIKTLNNLKKKETLINKFIEYIEYVKSSEDREIIMEIEQDMKNKNKKEKLKQLKLKQQQLHDEKNRKALERNTRFVVIGRKIPKIYKFNKIKKSMTNLENKVKDDMELLFYDQDD
jgi:hypothetical protein